MPMQKSIVGTIVINLISCIISCIFALGYMKNIFQALDGEEPQFSAYGQQARKIITYFVANLFMGIIVVFGICLFIIPGIYLALRLQFFTAFIVEEDTGIIESLKRSWEITRGHAVIYAYAGYDRYFYIGTYPAGYRNFCSNASYIYDVWLCFS